MSQIPRDFHRVPEQVDVDPSRLALAATAQVKPQLGPLREHLRLSPLAPAHHIGEYHPRGAAVAHRD
ncbi:MAG: hypothetical protein ACLPUO_06945 [Streptosporangiaceae bacterium]